MFSRFTRLPLRRCLHTAHTRPLSHYNRFNLTLGASATVVAYMTYRLTSDSHSIALDSNPARPSSSPSKTPLPSAPPEVQQPIVESSGEPSSSTDVPHTPKEGESSSEEAASGGAFNPVTGEINWDCPCLGGMAHGPCGPQFREAFSCFVFSEEEPKGINCVEKFKAMQTCFREHPEIYADEIDDDDDDAAPATGVPASDPESTSSELVPADTSAPQTPSEFLEEQPSQTLS